MQSVEDLIHQALGNPSLVPLVAVQLKDYCSYADTEACLELVGIFKAIIKDSSSDAPSKLSSLELLNSCAQSESRSFLAALGKKLIRRLAILASHRYASDDPEKGSSLFGAQSLSSAINQLTSRLFLQRLLEYFPVWARTAGKTDDKEASKISVKFKDLIKKGVKFPSPEVIPPHVLAELDICCLDSRLLDSTLEFSSGDTETIERLAGKLLKHKTKLDSDLSRCDNNSTAYMYSLITVSNALTKSIQKFQEFSKSRPSPPKVPRPVYIEEAVTAFKDRQPTMKNKPCCEPPSPRALMKKQPYLGDLVNEQSILEANLKRNFSRLYETSSSLLEERCIQMVRPT
jgi:hypothetical protein